MHPLNKQDLLTVRQQDAWRSGDRGAIKDADDAAVAQAILASLAELEVSQIADDAVTEDDLLKAAVDASLEIDKQAIHAENRRQYADLQAKKTGTLRHWFQRNGFDIVRNTGGSANNCLLISMLQHITGDYESEHLADAQQYRQQLMDWDPSIKRDDPLPSTGIPIQRLVDQIMKDKNSERRIAIAAPGIGSDPTYHFYGKGRDYAIIFDQSGHYEAVVPRRQQPHTPDAGLTQPPR